MGNLLVAVGGSGQHVALAIARAMQLKALPPDCECCIIDADQASALARSTQTFDGFVDEATGCTHPLKDGARSFMVPFDSGMAAVAGAGGGKSNTFRSLFVDGNHADSTRVFEALFPPEDADRDVMQGFYARPTLGATAFAAKQDEVTEHVRAKAAGASRVMVSGSFIGGTGAGVIPSLVRLAANSEKWYGAFHLQWMAQPQGDKDSVTQADMDQNMRHGLEYYYHYVAPRLKASLLMGPPPGIGGIAGPITPTRGETASFYHVLGAWAFFHFCSDAVAPYKNSVVAYNHDSARPSSLLDENWHQGVSLRVRLHIARRASALLGYYQNDDRKKQLAGAFKLFGSTKSVPDGLYESIKLHKKVTRFDSDDLIDKLVVDLAAREAGLRKSVAYFEAVFRDLGSDPELSEVESDPLARLKRIWSQEIVPPVQDGKLTPEIYVHRLADRLVEQLLVG